MKNILLSICLCVLGFASYAQDGVVKGKILDSSGLPLPGVNILIKGTTNGTSTDFDGNYELKCAMGNDLVISFMGFKPQTITVASWILNCTLEDDTEMLDELIVVGYGTQKKVNMTGSVVSVDAKKIENRPSESILKSLQGAIPGVTIISRPGETSINIRGRGNLGNSSPLYIVDGIEVSSDFFSNMDPSIIENLSFLKDASSAAIYGAKAAYGVVLVTTKTGTKGKLQVVYNGSVGFKTSTYEPEVVDSWTYAEMYRTSEINSGVGEDGLRYSAEDVANYKSGSDLDRFPNTNWFDEVLEDKALFTKHNLLFSGGSDKTKYAFGLGYLRNETFTPGEATDRYNFSSKTTSKLKPWLTVTSNVNFIYKKYDREKGYAALTEFLRVPPTQVAKHTNGDWGSVRDNSQASPSQINANPLRTWQEGGRSNSDTKHFLGSMIAEITPMEGLKISNQIGYKYWDYRGFSFQNKKEGVPSFLNPSTGIISGTASDVNQMNVDWRYSEKLNYDGWVNYEKTLSEVHNISAMAGIHADTYTSKILAVGRKGFGSNEMNALSGGSEDPDNQITTNKPGQKYVEAKFKTGEDFQEETTLSYFGRLTYNYNQRYLFEANLRADASSRFAKKGRWGYFPSFSAGWRMDQEAFLTNVEWLDNLKLRASWGQNGNINNVGLYDTYSTYEASGTALVNGSVVPTLVEGRIGNPNLTWETATTTNFGVDATFGNGLLGFSMDIYSRITDDILIQAEDVYAETGLDSSKVPARNVGSVRNRGIELALTHRKEMGDFSYQFSFNMAYNKNKILDLGNKVDQLPPDSYFILEKGESVGSFYMLEADGLYSTADEDAGDLIPYGTQMPEAGMVKFVDQNDDGVIDAKDRTIVAKDVPDFTYGMNLELNYKNLSLSVTGQGVSGVKMYMDNEASQAFFNNSVPRNWQKDNWTETNQNANYPKLFRETDDRYKYNSKMSSYWLFDASYFRIKNISLSYNISKELTQKVGLNKVRVYLSADNPFTIRGDHRMKDFDPERSSGRGAQLGVKTFTSGISITF
jgi:TonB-linked SusC/RagA family outer membrane protein